MTIRSLLRVAAWPFFAALAAGVTNAQGRGRAVAAEAFLHSDRCAVCHAAAPTATALWSRTGDDVSPHATWRATMMANSFRDPYWRAQVSKEVAAHPDRRAEIEALCVTCHAPAAHHAARLRAEPSPPVAAAAGDDIAVDGVTCTVCHQVRPEGLGTEATFSGRLPIAGDGVIFGPYPDPAFGPMRMHTGYTATHGGHVRDAGLCGGCHTLFTSHVPGGSPFPEQAPFLEWQNSAFAAGAARRTCQECHMPAQGELRIARNPRGLDFNIARRPGFRAHSFVGGNAFMVELLRDHREELGVEAPPEALTRIAAATRRQLSHDTADLAIEGLARDVGQLAFEVVVANRTGHKLPTGYPARRVWLRVEVRGGGEVLWKSGEFDREGRIAGVDDGGTIEPHRAEVTGEGQAVVYECVPVDADGAPTTYLTAMARMGKDNRLLPAGWRADGPNVEHTAPVGVAGDEDFAGGGDRVRFRVPVPPGAGGITVVAWLLYQSVPPRWVDPLRAVDTDEARAFVRMYDARSHAPETLAVTVASVR